MGTRWAAALVKARVGGVRWTVRADCAEWFLSNVAPRYVSIEHEKGVEVIKRSIRRIICRIGPPLTPQTALILKRQAFRGWQYRLKYLFLPSKMAHEWAMAWQLAAIGVPTFRPVAYGERRCCGTVLESVLASEEIAGAEKLSRFVESLGERVDLEECRGLIRALVRELAATVARMRQAGLYHRDLHGGNFMVRYKGDGEFDLYVIDLHAMWRLPAFLPWQERRFLALLARSLPGVMTRTNLARLLEWYVELSGRGGSWRRLLPEVEREATRREFELFEARDRRCLRTSTNFAVRRTSGRRITYRRILEGHPLVASGGEEVGASASYEFLMCSTPGAARAVWSALHGLRIRHVGAPRPHVLVERFDVPDRSGVLHERMLGAQPVSVWWQSWRRVERGERFRQKAALVRAAAERFHAACRTGVRHGSCTAENVLSFLQNGDWRVVFAPSANVTFARSLCEEEQLAMLAQFAASVGGVSRTTAWRFYRQTFAGSALWMKHETVRRVWREVEWRMRHFAVRENHAGR